ncbi:MAG: serine/threonine protein kinase [Planctomycetaceae bacterium]|nr:serine/threonine protein kinase [Planctomycetaceae bacterium]
MTNDFENQPTVPDHANSSQEAEGAETSAADGSEAVTGSSMPEQVGSWKIEKKIGSGGMGSVYLGVHEETGEQAAVKVLPASLAREDGFVARFNREIASMESLDNPHIVKFIDSGVDDETYYYSMEYVEGDTLTSVILREKRIPWEKAVEYAIQICSALKAAHDTGIVHRDLKPSNLLIDKDDQIKLTDFGVAQVFAAGKLTVTGGIIGTAEYMSPEQAQGTRASKKSDLYSLGAVMYAMICGRPPFSGKTTLEVIQKHKFGQFDRPNMYVPEIPLWLNDIICQLLEKEPDKRFPDAYVLSRRIQEKMNQHQQRAQNADLTLNASGESNLAETVASGVIDSNDPNATLMRDLMRAQIEAATQKGPIGSLLDNTVVLVMLLIIVVLGTAYFVRDTAAPTPPTEETELVDREPERLLKQVDYYREIGNDGKAWEILTALDQLVPEDDENSGIKDKINIRLKQIEKATESGESRITFLERSLARADDAIAADDPLTAISIYDAIIQLYRNDPEAEQAVREAEQMRSQLQALRSEQE